MVMIKLECRTKFGHLASHWTNFVKHVDARWDALHPMYDEVERKEYSSFFDQLLAEYNAIDDEFSDHILFEKEEDLMMFVLKWS
jgi:hypothetical protein